MFMLPIVGYAALPIFRSVQRLQARGNFFVEPQSPVYEGQVVGVNNKPDELDVNTSANTAMATSGLSTASLNDCLICSVTLSLLRPGMSVRPWLAYYRWLI